MSAVTAPPLPDTALSAADLRVAISALNAAIDACADHWCHACEHGRPCGESEEGERRADGYRGLLARLETTPAAVLGGIRGEQ